MPAILWMHRTAPLHSALPSPRAAGAHWERLTPQMRAWLARVAYFLPAVPWGREGWRETEAALASRTPDSGDAEMLRLELLCLELLAKARPLAALFDESSEEARKSSARNSVLPYQPHAPDSCPYPPKPSLTPRDPASHSALLLLLAPVLPSEARRALPRHFLDTSGCCLPRRPPSSRQRCVGV